MNRIAKSAKDTNKQEKVALTWPDRQFSIRLIIRVIFKILIRIGRKGQRRVVNNPWIIYDKSGIVIIDNECKILRPDYFHIISIYVISHIFWAKESLQTYNKEFEQGWLLRSNKFV